MKRFARLPLAFLAACSGNVNAPSLAIENFSLKELPWPAYCDFYESEAMQSKRQALFASQSSLHGTGSIMRIDGEMQKFDSKSEVLRGEMTEWQLRGDADYAVSFELRDSSDVPEIQIYSGIMTVEYKGAIATKNIIGQCSA